MTAEQLYGLATGLEACELLGGEDQTLGADDIFAVLEALQERGVDLSPAVAT